MNGNLKNLQSLTGKIKSFRIDTTLTKKGMCAESKAVGDALAAKVNISDIIDDLLSVASDKPLSANQGRLLKKLIDEIDPHYAENVLYNDTNVKDALDKVSKAENIDYDGDKSVKGAIDEVTRTLGYTVSKNYLSLSNVTTVTGAEQVRVNADVVTIKGTMTYQTYACNFGNYFLKKDAYTLSCVTNDYTGNGSKCGWRVCVNGSWRDISYSDTYTFELDSNSVVGVAYYSSVSNETSIDTTCTISQPMLCKASEDNTYDPYVPSVSGDFGYWTPKGTVAQANCNYYIKTKNTLKVWFSTAITSEVNSTNRQFNVCDNLLATFGISSHLQAWNMIFYYHSTSKMGSCCILCNNNKLYLDYDGVNVIPSGTGVYGFIEIAINQ